MLKTLWIITALETYAIEGVSLLCADGFTRQCYSILGPIFADYEEQVLITEVKVNQHCTLCTVPSNRRQKLCKHWSKRTHEYTQRLIRIQQTQATTTEQKSVNDNDDISNDMRVHVADNFAWRHHFVNIHNLMALDPLHQLYKGWIMQLMKYIENLNNKLLKENFGRKRKREDQIITKNLSGLNQLNHRFQLVSEYSNLKMFKHYSTVKQWSDNKQKNIARQIIFVIASMFTAYQPAAMHCARAIIDFIVIARYASHDTEFLKYLDHALYCIDKLKGVFKDSRPKVSHRKTVDDSDDDSVDLKKRHFNFPKFHVISHYKELIELYGSVEGFDTGHFKATHKYLVKCFYQLTNKREGFEIQIMQHNTRLVNMLTLEDTIRHQKFRKISAAKGRLQVQVVASSEHIKLNKLSCLLTSYERYSMEAIGHRLRFERIYIICVWANPAAPGGLQG